MNKAVVVYSSFLDIHSIDTRSGKQAKLEMIFFYNLSKDSVESSDVLYGTYSIQRKSRCLPLTIRFSLINTSGINLFIFHLGNDERRNMYRRVFLKNLALALEKAHLICVRL